MKSTRFEEQLSYLETLIDLYIEKLPLVKERYGYGAQKVETCVGYRIREGTLYISIEVDEGIHHGHWIEEDRFPIEIQDLLQSALRMPK